jgi:hypothetical protein
MDLEDTETKNDFSGESQRHFNLPTELQGVRWPLGFTCCYNLVAEAVDRWGKPEEVGRPTVGSRYKAKAIEDYKQTEKTGVSYSDLWSM